MTPEFTKEAVKHPGSVIVFDENGEGWTLHELFVVKDEEGNWVDAVSAYPSVLRKDIKFRFYVFKLTDLEFWTYKCNHIVNGF